MTVDATDCNVTLGCSMTLCVYVWSVAHFRCTCSEHSNRRTPIKVWIKTSCSQRNNIYI